MISSWLHSLIATACEHQIGSDSFSQREWVRLRNTVIHQSVLTWNNEWYTLELLEFLAVFTFSQSFVPSNTCWKIKKKSIFKISRYAPNIEIYNSWDFFLEF